MNIFTRIRKWVKGVSLVANNSFGSTWSAFWNFLSGTRFDYVSEAGRVYDNSVVGPAINWIWRNSQYLQFIVEKPVITEKGRKWEMVPDHALPAAIESGIYYDDSVLWYGTLLSFYTRGNAYWLIIRSGSGQIAGFVYVPHWQIRPMADKYNPGNTLLVTYYEFRPVGGGPIEIPIEDVVHFRYGLDPENQAYGLSPLFAAMRDIVGENVASTVSNALIRNGGMAGICFAPKAGDASFGDASGEGPTPEQEQKWLTKWRRYSTGDFAGTPMMMPFPMEVIEVGQPLDKLATDVLRRVGASRIMAAFGFDMMVLGLESASKTYSNYEEANEAAYEQGLLPTMKLLAKQLTFVLRKNYAGSETYRCGWDTSEVRALQPDIDDLHSRAREDYYKGIITRAEAKRMIGEAYGAEDNVYIQDVQIGMNADQAALKSRLRAEIRQRRQLWEQIQTDDGDPI
jgi:phage portal protein BeeE